VTGQVPVVGSGRGDRRGVEVGPRIWTLGVAPGSPYPLTPGYVEPAPGAGVGAGSLRTEGADAPAGAGPGEGRARSEHTRLRRLCLRVKISGDVEGAPAGLCTWHPRPSPS
jgi:hypothetical protein